MTWTIQKSVSIYDVVQMFKEANRGENFSEEALQVIMDDLQERTANDTGENSNVIDLDIIAICCEWSEESVRDLFNSYSSNFDIKEYIIAEDELSFYDNDTGEFSDDFEDQLSLMNDDEWDYHFDIDSFIEDFNNETYAVLLDNGNILYQQF